jgi:hypothetical protein
VVNSKAVLRADDERIKRQGIALEEIADDIAGVRSDKQS